MVSCKTWWVLLVLHSVSSSFSQLLPCWHIMASSPLSYFWLWMHRGVGFLKGSSFPWYCPQAPPLSFHFGGWLDWFLAFPCKLWLSSLASASGGLFNDFFSDLLAAPTRLHVPSSSHICVRSDSQSTSLMPIMLMVAVNPDWYSGVSWIGHKLWLEYSLLLLLFLAWGSLVCFSRFSLSVSSIVKTSGIFLLANLTQKVVLKYFGHFFFTSYWNYSLVFVNLSSPLDCELFKVQEHVLLSFLSFPVPPPPASYSAVQSSSNRPCWLAYTT